MTADHTSERAPQCDATDDVSADPCVLPTGHDGLHIPPTDECTCYLGNPELSDADEEACASCDAAFWRHPVFRLSDEPDQPVICDECGEPVQIACLIGDASNEAVRALLVAAHKRFHAEDRALAEAQREAARQMTDLGPLAADPSTAEVQP